MTESEAQKVIGMLATYFPGRLPEETQIAWALEIEAHRYIDGIAGARHLARSTQHPQLNALLECVESAKKERQRRETAQSVSALLPERAAALDPGRHERTAAAARAARELVESLAKKKAMPKPDMTPVPVVARNGHEVQTPKEAEARVRLLQEQAERLEREAMQDAFSEGASK